MELKAFNEFLNSHRILKDEKTLTPTHTRIGDKDSNIYPGKFHIPENELPVFYKLYKDFIKKGYNEYLTECQFKNENGQMVVDLDFRYCHDVTTRQHSQETIDDFIDAYLIEFNKYFLFDKNTKFNIYVMEKPNVNRLADGSLTKDGVHLVFGLSVPYDIQLQIRENMIQKANKENVFDLPLINSWDSVFDKGISAGSCNWMLLGSKKPDNECYQVVKSYQITFDDNDRQFMMEDFDFDFDKDFDNVVAQNRSTKYNLNPKYNKNLFQPISKSPTSITNVTNLTNVTDKTDKFEDLLFNVIGNGDYIDYMTWFKITATLKCNNYSFETLKKYTDIYDKENPKTEQVWNSLSADRPMSIYGLQKIAKKLSIDNKIISEKYYNWIKKYNEYLTIDIIVLGENDIAKFCAKKLIQRLVFCKKDWYYRAKNNLWSIIDDPCAHIISHIQDELDVLLKIQTDNLDKFDGDDDEKTMLRKKIKVIGETRYGVCKQMSGYRTLMKTYLCDNDFANKLDDNKYEIAYKDGILNLKTLKFESGFNETQFISKTIPFNYQVPSDEDKVYVKEQLKKICNYNDKHLEYYLSIFGYALTGDSERIQEFYYFLGQKASNGKSIIFESLTKIMPNYVNKFGRDTFDPKNSTLHKDIAKWGGVRIGWTNEIVKKVDAELLKDTADGTSIRFKGLYKNADDMNVTFKLFIVSNHSPTIDVDAGIKRRLRLAQMDSEFIDDLETEDFANCKFKRDTGFGIDLCEKYKHAFLLLLFEYSQKFFINEYKLAEYPAEWQKEANAALEQNDTFKQWFEENFEFGSGDDFKITEYSLKQIMKQNNFGNVKFIDSVKKHKWNCRRCNEDKTWYDIRVKENIQN